MRKRTLRAVSLLFALTLLAGCGQEDADARTEEEASAADDTVAVEIQPVERGSLSAESKVAGQVAAGDQESVYLGLSAQCKNVYVEVGDTVTSGQTLFTVDISSTLDNIKTTNMSMESTRKSYQDQTALLAQQLEQANNQLAQANNQLAMAQKNLEDTQALFEIGAASQLEVDNASMNVDSVKIGVDSAQLAINNLIASQNSAREQYALAVQNSQNTLNQLNTSLKGLDQNGNVAAPIAGTVISLNAFKNGFTSPGAPMATIESTADREISVSVSESLISKIRAGSPVHVTVDAAAAEFQGTIDSIENSANPATHLYGVTIKVPSGQGRGMRSGMFAEVTFYTDTQSNVVVVPTEAIQTGIDGAYVFTLDENNVAHRIPVQTCLVGDGVTEITEGLAGGEVLVTVGQFYLTDGAQVRVVAHGTEVAP